MRVKMTNRRGIEANVLKADVDKWIAAGWKVAEEEPAKAAKGKKEPSND